MLIVLTKPQVTLQQRVVQALSYSVVAALPVCLWLLRNHLLAETFVGTRSAGIWSLTDNAERAVLTLGAWALPWGRRAQDLELLIPGIPIAGRGGSRVGLGAVVVTKSRCSKDDLVLEVVRSIRPGPGGLRDGLCRVHRHGVDGNSH